MIYRAVKAIGRFLIKHSSGGVLLAALLTLFNSVFVDITTGKVTLGHLGSGSAIINYLFCLLLLVFWAAQQYGAEKEKQTRLSGRRKLLDAFCQQIYSALKLDATYRVSIFEREGSELVITGRFSSFDSGPTTNVRFKSGMGCVGMAYYTGSINVIEDLPNFEDDPDGYYSKMKKRGNMEKGDVDKLGRRNQSYLSVPIKHLHSLRVAAILCLDCISARAFTDSPALIEDISRVISPLVSTLFPSNGLVDKT